MTSNTDCKLFRKQYINNIMDYFKGMKLNEDKLRDKIDSANESKFENEAYKLYKMVKNNATENEINDMVEYLQKVPITYFEMRTFFG